MIRPASFAPSVRVAPSEGALLFIFLEGRLLLREDGALPRGRPDEFPVDLVNPLGLLDGMPVVGARLAGEVPPGFTLRPLRGTYGVLPEDLFGLAGYAVQIVEWDRTHRFCGACGTPTVRSERETSKVCPNCGLTAYPRVAPVVMVLVTRGEGEGRELLLARGPHFAPGMYSALAGFVEPSETLEHACHREVREEVGVEIAGLRYRFSQPWPFPHSLMIAFTAEDAGGDLALQPEEIEDAGWYSVGALPTLPPPFSIARRLIETVARGE
ncbi:NADH pyrophosphatase [Deinococcus aetherius]|uniref:NAD-capped RNA hydrolase NudC n=1 Tax=Deinococcus aetherius TaxID=200252 RepID=A0ABN6RI92_9DEIO|nr:NAD(+) diphosphatase [Deinococcus aetherius]BDP41317.1 NADH pyrophosphatase [Deinococcus aetherius]